MPPKRFERDAGREISQWCSAKSFLYILSYDGCSQWVPHSATSCMIAHRASGATPLSLDHCAISRWTPLSRVCGPAATYWTGSSESPEAKAVGCWFRCSCSEPSSSEALFFGLSFPICTIENRFSAPKVGHVAAASASPRSWLEVQVPVPQQPPQCP